MEVTLRLLLNRLDTIAKEHEEVGDTDVRESMSNAVFNGFLRPRSDFELPDSYAMFSEQGDQLVRQAIAEFLPAARRFAVENGLASFHDRLSAFQNGAVQSTAGSNFDDYFGWANPDDYDASGAAVRRFNA
jgi:hypothetical protein